MDRRRQVKGYGHGQKTGEGYGHGQKKTGGGLWSWTGEDRWRAMVMDRRQVEAMVMVRRRQVDGYGHRQEKTGGGLWS